MTTTDTFAGVKTITIDLSLNDPTVFGLPAPTDGKELRWCLPHWAHATEPTHIKLTGFKHASHPMKSIARYHLYWRHELHGHRLPDCVVVTLDEEDVGYVGYVTS